MVYSNDVLVPGPAVSIIIGKSGANIQKLRDKFNVKMMFLGQNSGIYEERSLRIIGTPKDVEMARKKVEAISNGDDLDFLPSVKSDDFVSEFLIPNSIFSNVIGHNGENIKILKSSLELSYIETEGVRILEDGKEARVLGIHGPMDKINQAKQTLQQLIKSYESKIINPPVDNDFPNDLWNSCSISSTTSSSSITSSTNTNRIIPHENLNCIKSRTHISEDSNNELIYSESNNNISKFNRFVSEVNNLFNIEYKRFNQELIDNMSKIAVKFYNNLEQKKNKNVFKMDYKNLLNEITEIKNELVKREGQIDELLVENDRLKSNYALCILCNKEPRNTIVMPCLHLSHCSICAKQLTICPTCNKSITSRLKIKLLDN